MRRNPISSVPGGRAPERSLVSDSQTCEYLGHSPWSKLPCVEPSSRDPRAGVGGGKGNPPGHPIWEAPNAPPLRSSSSNYVAIGIRCNEKLTTRIYLFFFSLFNFRFSFGLRRAFFCGSLLPLSLLPLVPIPVFSVIENRCFSQAVISA